VSKFTALVVARVTVEAVNVVDAQCLLRDHALQYLIEQAPALSIREVARVIKSDL
jgi:hypothetical protein